MNLSKYDEWKDTDAVKLMIYFLDAIVTESIEKLERMRDSEDRERNMEFYFMQRAYQFMKNHRALGLGVLGYHTMLQQKNVPFSSEEARALNKEVHESIQQSAEEATKELADMFGEPEVLKGYGKRNTTLTAIAPTKTSSAILGGVSQGIEPIFSNCYIADFAKAKVTKKNEELRKVLQKHGKDTEEVWSSIIKSDGSVQHLDFLTDHEKAVFLTFYEIAPEEIIDQAADRQ
jgi:ribonucleoside-diphosphate reductase alpha chain